MQSIVHMHFLYKSSPNLYKFTYKFKSCRSERIICFIHDFVSVSEKCKLDQCFRLLLLLWNYIGILVKGCGK
jgi:hypothetical protein